MLVELRPFVVLNGLPSLYGLKYDSATAYRLLLYLCSYKLDGSATAGIRARFNINCHMCIETKGFVFQNQFLAANSYIYRCLNLKCASDHLLYAQIRISGG